MKKKGAENNAVLGVVTAVRRDAHFQSLSPPEEQNRKRNNRSQFGNSTLAEHIQASNTQVSNEKMCAILSELLQSFKRRKTLRNVWNWKNNETRRRYWTRNYETDAEKETLRTLNQTDLLSAAASQHGHCRGERSKVRGQGWGNGTSIQEGCVFVWTRCRGPRTETRVEPSARTMQKRFTTERRWRTWPQMSQSEALILAKESQVGLRYPSFHLKRRVRSPNERYCLPNVIQNCVPHPHTHIMVCSRCSGGQRSRSQMASGAQLCSVSTVWFGVLERRYGAVVYEYVFHIRARSQAGSFFFSLSFF